MDMIRTAVNITGDAVVTCVSAKSKNKLDRDVYDDPGAELGGDDDGADPEAQEDPEHALARIKR